MSDMTDREAWARLQDALRNARDAARALALLRTDQRWLSIAGIMDQTADNVKILFNKSARQGSTPLVTAKGKPLILPGA